MSQLTTHTEPPHGLLVVNEPTTAALDHTLVDRAVHDLNGMFAKASTAVSRAVGAYIAAAFFDGRTVDFSEARKNPSLRALAERSDLLFNASTLWYAVRVNHQLASLPADVADKLPMSHHRLLVHVADNKLRQKLAQLAADKHLTKRAFEDAIKKATKPIAPKGKRRGRPTIPAYRKTIAALAKVIASPDDCFAGLSDVAALDSTQREELIHLVAAINSKLNEVELTLRSGGAA